MIPRAPLTPRIYGFSKVHKKSILLIQILSAINSPTQALAGFLAKQLQ